MPTIEVIAVNAPSLNLDQQDYHFAILEEPTLRSHRALFQRHLETLQGVIVHLGNPDVVNDKDVMFAGLLLDHDFAPERIVLPQLPNEAQWTGSDQSLMFKLQGAYFAELLVLLSVAQNKSPVNVVKFLTDYQFGPKDATYLNCESIDEFKDWHDSTGLRWNTLYTIGP